MNSSARTMTSASFLAFCASLQHVSRTNVALPMHAPAFQFAAPSPYFGIERQLAQLAEKEAEVIFRRSFLEVSRSAEDCIATEGATQ